MIWNKVAEESNGYRFENLDILDGQQRFITLFLLHAVLRDLSSDTKLATKVDQRLRQDEDKFDNIPERNRIEFVVRQAKTFLDESLICNTGGPSGSRRSMRETGRITSPTSLATSPTMCWRYFCRRQTT